MLEQISLNIPATDGYPLSSLLLKPKGTPRGVIQFHRGMLSPKEYYKTFCEFLAEQGFVVVSFDYRGMGASRPKSLQGFDARLVDWGRKDMTGVLNWIRRSFKDIPAFIVAHSMGGQLVGLMENSQHLAGVVTVASSTANWKYYSGSYRYKSALMWGVYFPLSLWYRGYLAMQCLGMGEDLPRDVAWELWSWCRGRGSLKGILESQGSQQFYEQVRCPFKALYFSDDNISTRKTISNYRRDYSNAQLDTQMIDPAELGVDKLGHYGFFKKEHQERLWLPVATWLQEQSENWFNRHPADTLAPLMYGSRGKPFQPQHMRVEKKSA